jgi:predicted Zn finger-like uncharacterized protein
MPLVATCPSCQQSYQVKEQFAGQAAKCRSCGQTFVVPQLPADDPFAAAAAMQGSLAALPNQALPHQALPNYGAAAYSAAAQDSSDGSNGSFSLGEPVEWAIRPGVVCSILGVGGFLLPLLGVQFKILALLGAAAPIVAGILVLAGAVFLFLGLKDNLLKAIPASGGVLVLALGAFAVSAFVENANNPQNNAMGHPLPQQPGGLKPGPTPSGPMPIRPQGAQPGINQPVNRQPITQNPSSANKRQFAAGAPLDATGELLNLDPPTVSLPILPSFSADQLAIAGNERTKPDFSDMAPAGSWLVGLRVVQSTNWGGAVCGIQPIYQLKDRYGAGEYCGVPGGAQQVLLLAKPGFAVSSVQIQSGLAMNALQVEFRQVKDQAMVAEGAYKSEWVGCEGGGLQPLLDGQGQPIVGLDGTLDKGKDLTSLRLYMPKR